MIFYATKKMFERYRLKTIDEFDDSARRVAGAIVQKEQGDRLLEWGVKLFYLDRKKCLVLMNFASKFTVFLPDLKVQDIENIGGFVAYYLQQLYKDDRQMTEIFLPKYFAESPVCVFVPLRDKSMISHLNHIVQDYALDGYRFYDFIENGILKTVPLNLQVNFNFLVGETINGKKTYIYSGERFKELLTQRYRK